MKQFAPILEGDRGRAADHQENKCWDTKRADYVSGQQITEICGEPITWESAWLQGRGLICAECAKNHPEDSLSYPAKV
jgi:hypothetical protein